MARKSTSVGVTSAKSAGQGRGAPRASVATKKPSARKVQAKKAQAKKAPAKKAQTKAAPAKKAAAKKATAEKATAKKAAVKKAAAKKTAAKKTAAKKSQAGATRRAAPVAKKTAAKKTVAKKAATKKTATKKATAKKATAKKATAAKATTKSQPSKTAPKKAAAKEAAAAKQAAPTKKTASTKKTAAKKAEAGAAGVGPAQRQVRPRPVPAPDRVSGFSAEELADIRMLLSEEIESLMDEVSKAESDLADRLRDGVDGVGEDQADQGSKASEREHEISLANNARDLVAQNRRAIERIDAGEYGVCESCGGPIGKERLRVFRRATLCVACKQREERR